MTFSQFHLGLVVYDDSDASRSGDDSDSDGERANDQNASDNDSDAEIKVVFNSFSSQKIIT